VRAVRRRHPRFAGGSVDLLGERLTPGKLVRLIVLVLY
jgi:hypothetical protein